MGSTPNSWKSSSKWPSQAWQSFRRDIHIEYISYRYRYHSISLDIDTKAFVFKKVSVNLPFILIFNQKSNPTTSWLRLICNSRWSKCGFSRFAVMGLGESDAQQKSLHFIWKIIWKFWEAIHLIHWKVVIHIMAVMMLHLDNHFAILCLLCKVLWVTVWLSPLESKIMNDIIWSLTTWWSF